MGAGSSQLPWRHHPARFAQNLLVRVLTLKARRRLVPVARLGAPWALVSLQDSQAASLMVGAGNLHRDSAVLPLPFGTSPDSADSLHNSGREQRCVQKRGNNRPTGSSARSGWRWTFLTSSRCSSPRSALTGPCFTSPSVWLSAPEGPVLIYAHHFLPQGTLLLPDISAFLSNLYHLFSGSWHRE